jgi:hypothetical protein
MYVSNLGSLLGVLYWYMTALYLAYQIFPVAWGVIPSGHLENTPSPSIEYCRTPYSRSRLNTERVKTSNRSGGSIEVLYENTNQHPAIPLKPWKKGGSLEVSHVFLPVLSLVFPFLGTSVTSPLTLRNPDWPTRT